MGKMTDECGHKPIFEALEPRLLLSGAIEGQLWNDLDADGVKDAGEPYLDAWVIELTDLLFGDTTTTTTAGGGLYSFDDRLPGDYEVRQIDEAGWVQTHPTGPAYHAIELIDNALGIDFGNVQTGSISGVKFDDLDGDGVKDAGEPGVNGWTIELMDSSTGLVADTAVTATGAEDGEYAFTDVIPGDYEICEGAQAGWVQTFPATSTYSLPLSGGDSLTGKDFGNTQVTSISGQKFDDLNANGHRDPGEPGLDGWTIELVDVSTGLVVDRAVTGSIDLDESGDIDPESEAGLYSFRVLNPVPVSEPYMSTIDDSSSSGFRIGHALWLPTGAPDAYNDNCRRYQGTMYKAWWVFDDLPAASYQVWTSWGAPVLAGGSNVPYTVYEGGTITVTSSIFGSTAEYTEGTLKGTQTVDQSVPASDEQADGIWWQSLGNHLVEGRLVVEIQGPQNVPAGETHWAFADAVRIENMRTNYIIREINQPGWTQSLPAGQDDGVYRVCLEYGQSMAGKDFGNYLPASISGQKFEDLDGDGVKDASERGLDGWTIELVDPSTSQLVDTVVTSGGGLYSFAGLIPGDYELREVLQSGWMQTYPDPNLYSLTLISGDAAAGKDFGNAWVDLISGQTFEDMNGNSVHDPGEPGLDGWTIELVDANTGQVVDTQITSGGGIYSFTGVIHGDYEVREVLQAEWGQTYPNPGVYSLTFFGGDTIVDKDFGNAELVSVSGQKFADLNSNGLCDSGEVGLDGWTIELVDRRSGQVVATTITASEDLDQSGDIDVETERGLYEFTGVMPDDYNVREVVQVGWTSIYPAAIGDEFPVNTETTGDQERPVVAVADSERSIVAWQSVGQDGDGDGIYAQILHVDGTPDGAEFLVNTTTADNQGDPAVAVDSAGNFVVVWTDDALDGGGKGVFACMFGADGAPLTGEIAVNSHITGDQSTPIVTMDSSGGFAAVWTDAGQDGDGADIYARRFTAAGLPATAEFAVNATTVGNQQHPAVAVDAPGTITITWDSIGQDGDGYGVYGRQFNSSGSPIGGEFLVNTETASHQLLPSISANGAGRFAIAWNSYSQDGDSYGVYAQRYNPGGSIDGGEFRVNTETAGTQASPSIAMDDAGNLAVVWASNGQDGDGLGIYGQLYNSDGSAADGEFAINNYTTGHQTLPVAAISGAGRLTLAWASNAQDTDGYGVYARQYAAFDSPAHMITLTSGQDVGSMDFGNFQEAGNRAPTEISLTGDSVPENVSNITVVGTVSGVDPDGDTLTFSLTDNAGGRFGLVGNTLVVADGSMLDYESAASHDVTVEASDGELTRSEVFTINILNVNEFPPTDISLNSTVVSEHSPNGTVVGTLSGSDLDEDALIFSLTDDAGGRFAVSGMELEIANDALLDYETATSHVVTIQASDGEYTYSETFTINVTDVNESPTDISLSSDSVLENAPNGAVVGTLSGLDPEGDALTFSLQDDAGGRFKIEGAVLMLADGSLLDYDVATSHYVTVETDDGEFSYGETLTIYVMDWNEAPTDISLTGDSVEESAPNVTIIGTFSGVDPDGDTLTFSLTDNAGRRFGLVGSILVVADGSMLDYESATTHDVTVQTSDGSLTYGETFTIHVTNIDDDPHPTLQINDVSLAEGDTGTKNFNFTVTLAASSSDTVSVHYETANDTATTAVDYVAVRGTLTFIPGQTDKTISVPVIGDTISEADEQYFVFLGGATNAAITDSQGVGIILNDDGYVLDVELRVVDDIHSDDHMSDGDFTSYSSIPNVSIGSTYYAEVWLRADHGIISGTVDIAYTTAYADAVAINNGGVYTILPSGLIHETQGLIDNLGGATLSTSEGVTQWVRLGWAEMLSTEMGEIDFTLGHDFSPAGPGTANPQFESTSRSIEESLALLEYESPYGRYPLDTIGNGESYKSRRGQDPRGLYTEYLLQDDAGTGGQYAMMDFNGWIDSDGAIRVYDSGLLHVFYDLLVETADSNPDWSGAYGSGWPDGVNTCGDQNDLLYKGEGVFDGDAKLQNHRGQDWQLPDWSGGTMDWGVVNWTGTPVAVTVNPAPVEVVARQIFYNNSGWDAGGDDDAAIASDKSPLLPGGIASSANYTGYSLGINGIMVDVYGLVDTPTAGDFGIRVNDMNPDTWSDGPAPDVSVRPVDGLDRVTLIWADDAIRNQWVEVTVRATANTGLAVDDVFYFANLVGDCDGNGEVGSSDYGTFVGEFGLRGDGLAADFNGDQRVDITDFTIMRGAKDNSVLTPTFPPAAPGAVVESGLGVLSVAAAATLVDPEIAIVKTLAPRDVKAQRLATGNWQLAIGENLTARPYGNGVAPRHVIAARACRTPNNDAATAVDLLVESPPPAGDISGAQAISVGSSTTTLYRAATAEYDLRPPDDDSAAGGDAHDLLADILAESSLAVPL